MASHPAADLAYVTALSLREPGNDFEYSAVCSLSGEKHFEIAVLDCPYAGAGCAGCDGGVKSAMAELRGGWRGMSSEFKRRKLAFRDVKAEIRTVLLPGPDDRDTEFKDPDSSQLPQTDSFRARHKAASDAIGEFDHAIRQQEEDDLSEGESF
jgi:hypothetical protein